MVCGIGFASWYLQDEKKYGTVHTYEIYSRPSCSERDKPGLCPRVTSCARLALGRTRRLTSTSFRKNPDAQASGFFVGRPVAKFFVEGVDKTSRTCKMFSVVSKKLFHTAARFPAFRDRSLRIWTECKSALQAPSKPGPRMGLEFPRGCRVLTSRPSTFTDFSGWWLVLFWRVSK